jgi:uncharacterized membrane protein YwaF
MMFKLPGIVILAFVPDVWIQVPKMCAQEFFFLHASKLLAWLNTAYVAFWDR